MMGRQMEFGFNPKGLGEAISPKKVRLYGSVLFSLNPQKYYKDYENPGEDPIYDVFCCFCFKGNLQLNKVVPLTEGNLHRGNSYIYRCTFCDAVFLGTIFFQETITWE